MGIIARQATLNTLLSYVGIGLGFVNVVLLFPKVLEADEFGLTRLMASLATIVAQVAQLGAENTVIRYFPYFRDPERNDRGLLGMLLLFGTVVGLVAALVVGLSHGLLSEIFSGRNALYGKYGLLVLPLILSEVYFILLRSYSRSLRRTVQPSFIREFVLRVLQTVLILVQAWKPLPFAWFMVLYTSVFLICTAGLAADLFRAGHFKLGWSDRWLPRRLRRSMTTYSGFTLSASVAGIVLGNMDQLMIGALLSDGLRYVAHYAVGFYFGSVIAAPGRSLGQVAVPLLADAWKRNDRRMIADLYHRSALVQTVISGSLFLLLWACVDDLFLLLPAEYAAASEVAVVIGLAYLLTSAIGLSAGIISMSRAYHLDAWSSLAMLSVNAVASFFLIRWLGFTGAAWATLLALTVVNAYRTYFLWRRFGLWPFSLGTAKVAGLVLTIGCLVPLIPPMGGLWMDMILRGVLVSAVFWPGVYFLGLVPDLVAMVKAGASRVVGGSQEDIPQ